MNFFVISATSEIPHGAASSIYLVRDNWDDWFTYTTQFYLMYVDPAGQKFGIGNVKIGQKRQERSPNIPQYFSALSDDFFSVGQDVSFYENLKKYFPESYSEILISLRDMALNHTIYTENRTQKVMGTSLMRYVSEAQLLGQFSRVARGGAELTEFHFSYTYPKYFVTKKSQERHEIANPTILKFDVTPNSMPPTNVHVMVGRNAVGKTVLLNNMIKSLVDKRALKTEVGKFDGQSDVPTGLFSNIVSISFSAFDENPPIADWNLRDNVKYAYIGLKKPPEKGKAFSKSKSSTELTNEFVESLNNCKGEPLRQRWKRAISILEADPIFRDTQCINLLNIQDSERFKEFSVNLFDRLSSGHKIVLLGITRLVEVAEEKSLVVIDEPETHLHPPLLSAFIRALSELMIDRNGVAVIATHSPVVLQEVPKSCVWQLQRSMLVVTANRLERETFGENTGVLTSDVFGHEVIRTGFHTILNRYVSQGYSYEQILSLLNQELGFEGRAILRALIAQTRASA
ncbi:AAA family ATPase [Bdellovibrio sp. HCB-110]|uniref:AAA family ATPase n=1 Tax=Bdellovibrio sp. HCB-110 TaxID=3391182 RepID=UPI0039B3A2DE